VGVRISPKPQTTKKMTINEKIHTTLTYKEISLIAVALGLYQESIEDKEMETAAKKIVDRLGNEMYDYPNVDHTQK